MNFLFGLAVAIVPAIVTYLLYRAVPKHVWNFIPKKQRKWRERVARFVCIGIFLIIFMTNFAAYGPRLSVDKGVIPNAPERVEAKQGSQWDDAERDRTGEADEKLEEIPLRAPITDAKDDIELEEEDGEPE